MSTPISVSICLCSYWELLILLCEGSNDCDVDVDDNDDESSRHVPLKTSARSSKKLFRSLWSDA